MGGGWWAISIEERQKDNSGQSKRERRQRNWGKIQLKEKMSPGRLQIEMSDDVRKEGKNASVFERGPARRGGGFREEKEARRAPGEGQRAMRGKSISFNGEKKSGERWRKSGR